MYRFLTKLLSLNETEKYLKTLMHPVVILDTGGKIIEYNEFANAFTVSHFGKPLANGEKFSEITECKELFEPAFAESTEVLCRQHFSIKKEKDEIIYYIRVNIIPEELGRFFLVTLVEEDRSENQKLISIISHDLIGPITSIMGFSEILFHELENRKNSGFMNDEFMPREDFEAFNKIIKRTKLINTSTKEAFSLLENLLEWSRTKSNVVRPNIERINLNEIIETQISFCRNQADFKSIEIIFSRKEENFVLADRNMLKTVLRNIISNSVKFTPRGGGVGIKTSPINKGGKKFVKTDVTDTGVGIPDKTMKQLFIRDQNITTKGTESEKGSGIGLKICKEFAEKMGGTISIKSQRGKGTIASITLPSA